MADRTYPDGSMIPAQLPESYRVGNARRKCGNCTFFSTNNSACSKWIAEVKEGYLCNAWEGQQGSTETLTAAPQRNRNQQVRTQRRTSTNRSGNVRRY